LIKYWMLGNSLLGKAIDAHDVDLVLHGHAHLGNHRGQTPGGVPVRNVAAQVTGRPMLFDLSAGRSVHDVHVPFLMGFTPVGATAGSQR
jgi:Icc-related predicted phosphoesterase